MIPYTAKLISEVEGILRVGFANTSVVLNRIPERHVGPFHIILQDSYEPGTRIRDNRFASCIRTTGIHSSIFYFGFVALFGVSQFGEDMHAHVLDHVSLSIFQSYPGGDLYPVIRAEWDAGVINDTNAFHAQPHWHFSQSAKDIEKVVRSFTGAEAEFGSELLFDSTISLADIHFAMSTLWDDKDQNIYKRDFVDSADFVGWFRQLVTYISAQLVYICGGQASEVMEFDPG